MVGVPRSNGCSTCKARSVKCDEARPSCSQCRRGGRKCAGYKRSLKFIDENAKLRDRAQNNAELSEIESALDSSMKTGTMSHRSLCPSEEDEVFINHGLQRTCKISSHLKDAGRNMPKLGDLRPVSRSLERENILASFVQDLFPLGGLNVQYSFIGSWLWHVPAFLHKNTAMDMAAESLALTYFAKQIGSTEMHMRSRSTYTNALESLSIALKDSSLRLASETLCATLLLIHYENFVGIEDELWIKHSGAAGHLIRLRGPERHRSGFDCAMYMASRGYLISQAVMTGDQCFLEDDTWQSIPVDANGLLMPDNTAIYHEGLNLFAIMPGIIHRFQRSRKCDGSIDITFFCDEVIVIRSNMMAWFQKLQSNSAQPIRALLHLPTWSRTMFPAVYEYCDIITATFAINYSAYMIKLNVVLRSLGSSGCEREEDIALAKDICMSAAYCSRGGFCGTQAMAFALPTALAALPESYSGWIQQQIEAFKSIRKSTTLRSAMLDDDDSN